MNRTLGSALAAVLVAGIATAVPATASAQVAATKPTGEVMVAVGAGKMVRLPGVMSDLFVADAGVADVQVRSATQIYIFGKGQGETTIYATNKAGKVIYSTNVRVGTNIDSVDKVIKLAMPEANIRATSLNGVVLLTGTVKSPEDIEQASTIVQSYVGDGTKIISRLKTATPLQVMLRVRFAEVSRSLSKDIGFNLMNRDKGSGILFGIFKGSPGTITDKGPIDPATNQPGLPTEYKFITDPLTTTLGIAGRAFGMDVMAALQLAEADGRATILAEPTLTALSGETASFLAGGEFPIPMQQTLGAISVDYKQYGIGLAFTPTVLDDGRISMRVRPEVSEISDLGAVKLNNFTIPGLATRRAETTIELGSGQSFMIGGLLRNTSGNTTDKAPWLGDLPILGALFRSNSYRRQETELVIIVTPYLVKPMNENQVALPTDGFRTPSDAKRILLDQSQDSLSYERRPGPTLAPPTTVGAGAPSAGLTPSVSNGTAAPAATRTAATESTGPGFSF